VALSACAHPSVTSIAVSTDHACAALADGHVACMGMNRYGQLGDGTRDIRRRMTRVKRLDDAVDIAVTENRSCARTAKGRVFCWGNDLVGGDGRPRPEAMRSLGSIVSLSHGRLHACASAEDGAVWCWGSNEYGQLGDGGGEREARAPVRVRGIPAAASVACGGSHSCALLRSGKVMCWGNNYHGQAGDGSYENVRPLPVPAPVIEAAAQVAAGEYGTCVRHVTGRVSCWGLVESPKERVESSPKPTAFELPGMDAAAAIAMHVDPCVIDRTGAVFCWERVATTGAPAWIKKEGLDDAVRLNVSRYHVCTVSRDGGALCWANPDSVFGVVGHFGMASVRQVPGLRAPTDSAGRPRGTPSGKGSLVEKAADVRRTFD
jgi:alpha-tubulin suppressor-like RCC1 family protein